MTYSDVIQLKETLNKQKQFLSSCIYQKYEESFIIEYTHNSTAIEGNTLSLIETKAILEDGISVGGKELREIYEVVNHRDAYVYILNCIKDNKLLGESIVKDIHNILMSNIFIGGIYRDGGVRITGASHKPPEPADMYYQIKKFYEDIKCKEQDANEIELAAFTHAEFVKIHPFADGNGRAARLLMNYQLISKDFLPLSIPKEDRLEYYVCLDEYALNNNLNPFTQLITDLEYKRLKDCISLIPDNIFDRS
ncbi:MAG: Fic family protein [Oscillospiraceae bacterium]|jgi:Fic family protein|nr:Fic family protein [Oscillospiraceae bacterium]